MKKNRIVKTSDTKEKIKIVVVLGVLIVCIIAFMIFKINSEMDPNAKRGTVDGASASEIDKRLEKKVDPNIQAVSINQRITFQDAKSEGILNIENLPENNYNVIVEIYSQKDETLIYQTKKIEPGYILKKDKLLKELKKGVYLATAVFKGYDKEGNIAKQASAQIEITIKK